MTLRSVAPGGRNPLIATARSASSASAAVAAAEASDRATRREETHSNESKSACSDGVSGGAGGGELWPTRALHAPSYPCDDSSDGGGSRGVLSGGVDGQLRELTSVGTGSLSLPRGLFRGSGGRVGVVPTAPRWRCQRQRTASSSSPNRSRACNQRLAHGACDQGCCPRAVAVCVRTRPHRKPLGPRWPQGQTTAERGHRVVTTQPPVAELARAHAVQGPPGDTPQSSRLLGNPEGTLCSGGLNRAHG